MTHPRPLPCEAQRCPACRYDLVGTISGGIRRCPECGRDFTWEELQDLHLASDAYGEPISLSPHERRISGRALIIGLASLLLLLLIALVAMVQQRP